MPEPTQLPFMPAAAQQQSARSRKAGFVEPDFVTAMFDLLCERHPELQSNRPDLEQVVRNHFKGARAYVAAKPDTAQTAVQVLTLFNGRNAREVARRLGISRATVYRVLKQSGREPSRI